MLKYTAVKFTSVILVNGRVVLMEFKLPYLSRDLQDLRIFI